MNQDNFSKLPFDIKNNIFEYATERNHYFLKFKILHKKNAVFVLPLKLSENNKMPLMESFFDIFHKFCLNLFGRLKLDLSSEIVVFFESKKIEFVCLHNSKTGGIRLPNFAIRMNSPMLGVGMNSIEPKKNEDQQNVKNMIRDIGEDAQNGRILITVKTGTTGKKDLHVIDNVQLSIIKVDPHIKALSRGWLNNKLLFKPSASAQKEEGRRKEKKERKERKANYHHSNQG
jgi:hypothetical protein